MRGLLLLAALASAAGRPEAVRVKTSDGWELSGVWRAAGRKKGVVLLHGLASQKEEWDSLAEALAKKGVSSLALDLRGHGTGTYKGKARSFQTFIDHGPSGEWAALWKDGEAGLKFLKAKGCRKRGLGGASVGANAAADAASRLPDAAFLILLSPGQDYQGIRGDKAALDYGPRPLLLAASAPDAYAFQTVLLIERLRKDSALPVERMEASAGHGVQIFAEPKALERVAAWIAAQ